METGNFKITSEVLRFVQHSIYHIPERMLDFRYTQQDCSVYLSIHTCAH